MVLGILVALAVAGTAFVVFMREAGMAANNTVQLAQAELAARSGLEHAVRVILRTYQDYYCSDSRALHLKDGSWVQETDEGESNLAWSHYFKDSAGGESVASWIDPGLKGRVIKLTDGVIDRGEYAVGIVDLDSKLHANIAQWPDRQASSAAELRTLLKAVAELAGLGSEEQERLATRLANPFPPCASLSEVARRAEVVKYSLEKFFTVYPVNDSSGDRPAVNVNTVPVVLLTELLKPIPSLDDATAAALAAYLAGVRPFVNRHEFEEAIFRVTADDDVADLPDPAVVQLRERQFNDVLNSASDFDVNESAYDEPDNACVYSFDGWAPYKDGIGPAQIGGRHSDRDGAEVETTGAVEDNVTWSTELKFTSRFFHIYVVGWAVDPNATTAERRRVAARRCHAVYDADARKVVWFRWNHSSHGNVMDAILP